MTCITHHHACDCREHQLAVLIKASLDAAFELDEVKLLANISQEERERLLAVVERVNAACEALGQVFFTESETDDLFSAQEGWRHD